MKRSRFCAVELQILDDIFDGQPMSEEVLYGHLSCADGAMTEALFDTVFELEDTGLLEIYEQTPGKEDFYYALTKKGEAFVKARRAPKNTKMGRPRVNQSDVEYLLDLKRRYRLSYRALVKSKLVKDALMQGKISSVPHYNTLWNYDTERV